MKPTKSSVLGLQIWGRAKRKPHVQFIDYMGSKSIRREIGMRTLCHHDDQIDAAPFMRPLPWWRRWSPLRFWRRLVAYREWQDQIAVCQKAGPEYYYLAQEAEQRYKELCK